MALRDKVMEETKERLKDTKQETEKIQHKSNGISRRTLYRH